MSIVFSKERQQKIARIAATAPGIFSGDSVGDTCLIYPGQPRAKTIRITWKATMWTGIKIGLLHAILLLFGHFGVSAKTTTVTFDTFHPISTRGLRRLRMHRFIALTIGVICYFLMLLGFVAFVIGLFSLLISLLPGIPGSGAGPGEDYRNAWHLILASAGTIAACVIAGNYARRYGLPGPLRHIAEWPLELFRWKAMK